MGLSRNLRQWLTARTLGFMLLAQQSVVACACPASLQDILLLARRKLIDAASLRARSEDALKAYVGNITLVRNTINIACRLIESLNSGKKAPGKG